MDPGADCLGPHWNPYRQVWIQTRLGDMVRQDYDTALLTADNLKNQAVPGLLRLDGLPMVCLQSDHDQRGLPAAPDVSDLDLLASLPP